MVTICTASLTFNNSTFCPHSVFMCFVWISVQTAITSQYNINWLVFITEMECVYCAVRPEYLNIHKFTFIMLIPCNVNDLQTLTIPRTAQFHCCPQLPQFVTTLQPTFHNFLSTVNYQSVHLLCISIVDCFTAVNFSNIVSASWWWWPLSRNMKQLIRSEIHKNGNVHWLVLHAYVNICDQSLIFKGLIQHSNKNTLHLRIQLSSVKTTSVFATPRL